MELLKHERRARVFFLLLAQSALGTGAGYVALLVIAYERFHSPWALSLVLLADFAPSMVLAPVLGAAADRWSRRSCMVVADGVRAVAFIAIALVGSFEATFALALLAGVGTALFRPASMAALPSLVSSERSAAATSLYAAVTDLGYTVGPAVAAALFAVLSPEGLLLGNGITFVISAVALTTISFGATPVPTDGEPPAERSGLIRETGQAVRALRRIRAITVVVSVTGAAMLSAGVFNVIELPFIQDAIGSDNSGYSVVVAVLGLGFLLGSLTGAKGGDPIVLQRRFVEGVLLIGAAGVLAAVAPSLVLAALAFGLGGFGNGVFIAHQRLLIQAYVPSDLQGRIFGVSDTFISWGFALSMVGAGAVSELVGLRELMFATGAWEIALGLLAAVLLVRTRRTAPRSAVSPVLGGAASGGDGLDLSPAAHVGEERTHLVGGRAFWLTLLDDLDERVDDGGVELGARVG
jgi:MFS family permease